MKPALRSSCRILAQCAVLSLAAVSFAALPSFAEDAPPRIMKQQMKQLMLKDPELMKEMMADPNHALAMAYRQNLMSFAKALKMAARQGNTIPLRVARTAVDEMKRSADLLEKEHSAVLSSIPEEKRSRLGDLPKLMDEHLAGIKASIGRLDALAKEDPVSSKAVTAELQDLFVACNAAMHGMQGGDRMGRAPGTMPCHNMMTDSGAHDAELADLADRMNSASGTEKTDIMADILTRLVRDRAEMVPPMHGGHPHDMMRRDCGYRYPCPCPAPSQNDDGDDGEDE